MTILPVILLIFLQASCHGSFLCLLWCVWHGKRHFSWQGLTPSLSKPYLALTDSAGGRLTGGPKDRRHPELRQELAEMASDLGLQAAASVGGRKRRKVVASDRSVRSDARSP